MAKYLTYKDFSGNNIKVSQTNLKKAMKDKGVYNKEHFITAALRPQNKDSELRRFIEEHFSMHLI